jgi:HSP20 family molecular chaperone IbpA|tara:strand:- start:430 stop:861 length:432 start_codon:yes stop_codon:yes gene_type:complete
MSTLFFERQLSPFDLLFKDFFKSDLNFQPATEAKIPHPVDVFETKNGLHFEVACTGLSKSDVELNIEGDILKIAYNKDAETIDAKVQERNYIHKGIAKRSFNLGYKIASKFDLSKAEALMENGLLAILIPFADEAKPKVLKIK